VIRLASSEADLELCARIKNEIDPHEPVTPGQLQDGMRHGHLFLHGGGGYAYAAPSSVAGSAFAMVRVAFAARRQGVGSALLDAIAEYARGLAFDSMWGRIRPDDEESLAFAGRRGFREIDREVELVRPLSPGEGELAQSIVELRQEHEAGAYAVAVECIPDMPLAATTAARSFEHWAEEELAGPVCFVALDADRVVGYAALRSLPATPSRLEHGLTAVLRSHRGRGIATALKQAQIAWAAANGYRELVTETHTRNAPMRAVNRKLGYVERPGMIVVRGSTGT
jgi:mycothiol synthase